MSAATFLLLCIADASGLPGTSAESPDGAAEAGGPRGAAYSEPLQHCQV